MIILFNESAYIRNIKLMAQIESST